MRGISLGPLVSCRLKDSSQTRVNRRWTIEAISSSVRLCRSVHESKHRRPRLSDIVGVVKRLPHSDGGRLPLRELVRRGNRRCCCCCCCCM